MGSASPKAATSCSSVGRTVGRAPAAHRPRDAVGDFEVADGDGLGLGHGCRGRRKDGPAFGVLAGDRDGRAVHVLPLCTAHGPSVHLPELRTPHHRDRSHRRLPPSGEGCSRCGFGFLFELLDDYYPAPDAAFFVCDAEGRVIGCGRGSFELTGLDDERVIGRQVRDVLGLRFDNADDPVGTVLEWGVRALNKPVEVNAEGDLPARATADLFPAYDDDGGMLLVLTPAK